MSETFTAWLADTLDENVANLQDVADRWAEGNLKVLLNHLVDRYATYRMECDLWQS